MPTNRALPGIALPADLSERLLSLPPEEQYMASLVIRSAWKLDCDDLSPGDLYSREEALDFGYDVWHFAKNSLILTLPDSLVTDLLSVLNVELKLAGYECVDTGFALAIFQSKEVSHNYFLSDLELDNRDTIRAPAFFG